MTTTLLGTETVESYLAQQSLTPPSGAGGSGSTSTPGAPLTGAASTPTPVVGPSSTSGPATSEPSQSGPQTPGGPEPSNPANGASGLLPVMQAVGMMALGLAYMML